MQRIQDMFINMEEVAEDAYKNTELLLSQYTKVMFRIEKNLVDIDYEMYAESRGSFRSTMIPRHL